MTVKPWFRNSFVAFRTSREKVGLIRADASSDAFALQFIGSLTCLKPFSHRILGWSDISPPLKLVASK